MIRRLLYVPDYEVSSLNSSWIWSLSLQLTENNSQLRKSTNFFFILLRVIIVLQNFLLSFSQS